MVSQEDIIKPLLFLDIFDYPLTAMEIWRFLPVKAELGELLQVLGEKSPLERGAEPGEAGCVTMGNTSSLFFSPNLNTPRPARGCPPLSRGELNGFYFLAGREGLIEKRREFFYLSEKKFKIAKRAAWLLHFIPTVKMVAICNNFYYRPESDIDFFIITAPKRLWLTRFCATIILDLFRLRARGQKTADRVCLSFYLSEDNLNLEEIALKPAKYCGPTDLADPYFCYWLGFLEPIYGLECYERLWVANSWIKNFFPNILPKQPVKIRCVADNAFSGTIKRIRTFFLSGVLGDWLEKSAQTIQWWKINPQIKAMAATGDTRVVINDKMLKFHENDRRREFREQLRIKKEELRIN